MTAISYFRRPMNAMRILLVPFLLHSPNSVGQEVPQPPAQKIERVEVTARPMSDNDLRRRAPVAKQIYGREDLDKFGDSAVTDVLKRLPGVDVVNGSPRLRGLGAGYTLILINGEPAPTGFQLEQLNPKLIDRIEINKSLTADQSSQAVAGVINIFLKDVPRVRQNDLQLRVGYRADRPLLGASFVFGERAPGGLGLSLPVSFSQWRSRTITDAHNNQLGIDQLPAEAATHILGRNWGKAINTTPKITWKIDERQTLAAQAFINFNDWHFENTASNRFISGRPANIDDQDGTGHFSVVRLGATYTNRLDDAGKLELKLGAQNGQGKFRNGTFINGGIAQNAWLRENFGENSDRNITQSGKYGRSFDDGGILTGGWDVEHRRRERTTTTFLIGGGTQQPDFDGQPFVAHIKRHALFIQHEWDITPTVSTYMGIRKENIEATSEGGGDRTQVSTNRVAPLAQIQVKLDPKGKSLIRAGLSSSFKMPDPVSLMGRLTPNRAFPDLSRGNDPLAPDSLGNPLLRPETATGIDIAWERYLSNGGIVSMGIFARQVNNLVRNQIELMQGLPGTTVARWVEIPRNIGSARTKGLEFEVKGRIGELFPSVFAASTPLGVRSAFNLYRSEISSLQAANNRLENQQPWTLSLGMDYQAGQTVIGKTSLGGSVVYIPSYATRLDIDRLLKQGESTTLDLYVFTQISDSSSLRFAAQKLSPAISNRRNERIQSGLYTDQRYSTSTHFTFTLDMKL